MPFQISPEAFKWLQSLSLARDAKRNQNSMMELTEQTTAKLVDGHAIGLLLRTTSKGKEEAVLKKLQALKENSTPAIRLYNWGILTQVFKQMGFTLEYAEKSKLTNQDPEPLTRLFTFLCQMRSKDPNAKTEPGDVLKVDIAEIAKKGSRDANNALEFLTILISKHFKISPQQTLNLFLDNNKYLSHLLAKGVKNSFEPIYALLNDIKAHSEFVVLRLFSLDEEQNVNFVFNSLRTCLIGKDENTAVLFCDILMEIYHQYRLSNLNLQALRNWIKNEGINTLFFSIKKQPLIMANIIEICYSYLDDQFFKFIQLSEKSILWSTDHEKLIFYKNFVEETTVEIIGKFAITNFFDEWNRMMLKTMKKTKDSYEIIIMIGIMEVQWNKLGSKFQQHDLGMANQFINFLKGVLSVEGELLFVQSCRTLFSLMQSLGSLKNAFAPLIYKILITAYSSINDSSRIAFISDNFIESFKGISGLPGSALVQPLLKHLQKNLESSVINLCQAMISEKRINDEESMDLIEMFTKILFQDIRFGNAILEATFEGLPNISDELVFGYLENNVKLSLAQLYSSSKAITKTIKALKEELARIQDVETKGKAAQNFVNISSKHIICKNLIGFISKALLVNESLKRQSQSPIFQTYIKIKVELKKPEQAELLKPVMLSYYEDDQLQQKIAYYMDKLFPPKPKPQPLEKGHSHDHSDHDHVSKSVSLRPATAKQEEKQTTVILDPTLLKPSSFAIRDLQKLKQKRYQMKTTQQQKQRQRLVKAQKIEKFKTIQHEKRLIESMTTIKNDVEYNHLQTLDNKGMSETIDMNTTSLNKEKDTKDMHAVGIKLINLQKQQEETYREDAQSIMRKYRKVWRYLFYKYSSKKQEGGGQEKTHMGDAWKLLKDYEFSFFKKEQCFTIVRLINQNLKRKNDIQFLTYVGFQDFILQTAMIGYSKQGFTHIPPGQQLLLFIQQLKKITKQKSGSIEIFQNPEEAYFQQTEVIREFNKRLKENPDYILPQGYKRIKQTTLEYEYDFHPMLQKNLNTSYITVLQVLDSIFMKHPSFGFHLIEPLSIKNEAFLAKPVLFQNLSLKMKDYKQGYLNPTKRSISATGNQLEQTVLPSPPIVRRQFKPYINFSLGIKLGIAETSIKNKSIAEQVAYCMEDILNAIENQSPVVKKGNKRRTVNDYMRKKKTEITRVQTQRKREEVNWKKRAQSVKLQVQALRQKRKESQKQKKKKEYVDKRAKKQKEDKTYKQRLEQFQRVKAKIAEKKETLLQLKAKQQQKIKKQKEEYKLGVEQYFRKKKEELKETEQQYKKGKAQQKQKKQQKQQKKQEFVKKLYLSNLKKQEKVLEKIDQIKEAYQQTWKSQDIQSLFSQKKQSLKLLFDLLLKYEKSKISATNYDEIGLATLNYFCLKFKLIPFMLQKQDVNKIYIYALKQSEDKKKKGIDFEKFQQVLFLISVKAKKLLNKLAQKQKKRQKKVQAFLNAQKCSNGNHFETKSVDESSSSSQSEEQQKPTLQDEYLFNTEDVSEQTVDQVISFLKLPSDKASMEQRYKQAMETKTSKPKNQIIMQIKESLDES